jgi:hypothetical protein
MFVAPHAAAYFPLYRYVWLYFLLRLEPLEIQI